MTDAVETMAYAKSGGLPWHGLGEPVTNKLTPEAMLKVAKIDWTVSKRPVFWDPKGDGKMVKIDDKELLVRDTDQHPLSMVGANWKPVQNLQAVDFMTKFVKEAKMEMETMGSLWYGKYIWALARIKKSDFAIQKDELRTYILLCSPHVLGHALSISYTNVRVVCWNTLTMALGSSLKGKGKHAFNNPHSIEFTDDVKAQAAEALGLAVKQTEEFKQVVAMLAKKKAAEDKVEAYFANVMQYDPEKAKKEGRPEPRIINKFREALVHAPGQDLNTAKGTWWGALNAVTHVVDHNLGRDRDTALRTAWFGQKAGYKRRALDLAMQAAS